MEVTYRVNSGAGVSFWVPGRGQNMRWAGYSVSVLLAFAGTERGGEEEWRFLVFWAEWTFRVLTAFGSDIPFNLELTPVFLSSIR